jgi:hypothetical protein
MSDTYVSDTPPSLIAMPIRKLLFIIVVGVVAGMVTWGLMLVLDTYVYKAVLCNRDAVVQCASSQQYAMITATIIGAAAGLFGLVRLHVFRPLLIVIATFVSLWGLLSLLVSLPWYGAMLIAAIMYGLAFGVFAWLVRIRKFFIALVVVIVVVVAVRLVLSR